MSPNSTGSGLSLPGFPEGMGCGHGGRGWGVTLPGRPSDGKVDCRVQAVCGHHRCVWLGQWEDRRGRLLAAWCLSLLLPLRPCRGTALLGTTLRHTQQGDPSGGSGLVGVAQKTPLPPAAHVKTEAPPRARPQERRAPPHVRSAAKMQSQGRSCRPQATVLYLWPLTML